MSGPKLAHHWFLWSPINLVLVYAFYPESPSSLAFVLPSLTLKSVPVGTFSLSFFFFLSVPHGLWDLSCPTRDPTRAQGSESEESQPLDRQGIPIGHLIKWSPTYSYSSYFTSFPHLTTPAPGTLPLAELPFVVKRLHSSGDMPGL